MSVPRKRTRPADALYWWVRHLKKVLLPAPFGPIRQRELAFGHGEIHMIDRDHAAEAHCQIVRLQDGHSVRRRIGRCVGHRFARSLSHRAASRALSPAPLPSRIPGTTRSASRRAVGSRPAGTNSTNTIMIPPKIR